MKFSNELPHLIGSSLSEPVLRELYHRWHQEGARVFVSNKNSGEFKNTPIELLLAWSAEWGRSEPRLLEVLLDWLWNHWKRVHPAKLNEIIKRMPTPAIWGVLYEWTMLRRSEMTPGQSAFWIIVLEGIAPEANRYFFSEGKLLNFNLVKNEISRSRKLYTKWGFIGSALPSISEWKNLKPALSKEERLRILKSLSDKKDIHLTDYLAALPFQISRQSAWRDLRESKFLKKRGKTKGAVWRT